MGLLPIALPPPLPRIEPFVFVVPAFNAAAYIGRCLESVRAQRGPWGAVVVDDCSTDDTWSVIQQTAADDPRFTLVRNAERRFQLWNVDHAITVVCANPDSVIAVLDGDDWLLDDDVVEIFLRLHAAYDVVWSNSLLHPGGELGWSNYLPPHADVRHYSWVTSHLRTFKKHLFDRIDKQDFRDIDGRYYSAAGDVAFMLPLLELAGPAKRSFLDKVCCVYNRENALNEDKLQGGRQSELVARIRARPPYQSVQPLTDEELAARGRTPWEPYGNVPVEFHADGAEFVFFGPATADPPQGSYAGVRRVASTEPGTDYVVTVNVRDSYSQERFGGGSNSRSTLTTKSCGGTTSAVAHSRAGTL